MYIIVIILVFLFYVYLTHYPCVIIKNKLNPISYFHNVPKIVYRTHRTMLVSRSMYEYCHQKWVDLNPGFTVVWYTNKDCTRFMEKMGNRIFNAYNKIKPGAFKADLWRACILYKYGGIYVDSYCTPEVGLEGMLEKYWITGKDQFISIEDFPQVGVLGKRIGSIHNGFMVSTRYNPILKKYIERMVKNIETNYYGEHTLDITGPVCLYKVLREFPDKYKLLHFSSLYPHQSVEGNQRVVMKKKYSFLSWFYEKIIKNSTRYGYQWENRIVY